MTSLRSLLLIECMSGDLWILMSRIRFITDLHEKLVCSNACAGHCGGLLVILC